MGITFSTDINQLFKGIVDEVIEDTDTALDDSAEFMRKQLDASFDNKGFLQQNRRKEGFEPYMPTTMSAKRNRESFPKAGSRTGKKGFTQKQAQYMFAANSLEDTGKMRESLVVEDVQIGNQNIRYVGVGVPYIETHEKGGTVTVDGESFDVPARPFQHITEKEQETIEEAFKAALS